MKKKNNFFKTLALLLILPIALMFVGCGPKTTVDPADQGENQQQEQQQDNQGDQGENEQGEQGDQDDNGGNGENNVAVKDAAYQSLKSVLADMTNVDYTMTASEEMAVYTTVEPILEEEEEEAQEVTLDEESAEENVAEPMLVMSDYGKVITHVDMANGQMVGFSYDYNPETKTFNDAADEVCYIVKIGEGNDAIWAYLSEYEGVKSAVKYSPDHVAHEYGLIAQVNEMAGVLQGDTIEELIAGMQDSELFDEMLNSFSTMLMGVSFKFDFDVDVEIEDDVTTLILLIDISIDTAAVQTIGEEENEDAQAMQFECNFEMKVKFTSNKIIGFYRVGQMSATMYGEEQGVAYKATMSMDMKDLTEFTYQAFDTTLLPNTDAIAEYGEVQERDRYIYIVIDGQRQGISNYSYEWSEELEEGVATYADKLVLADLDLTYYGFELDEDKFTIDGWYLDEACTISAGESVDFKSYDQEIYAKRSPKDGYAVIVYKFGTKAYISQEFVDVVDVNSENSLPSEGDINEIAGEDYIFTGFVDAEGNEITSFEDIGVENQGYYVIYGLLEDNPAAQYNQGQE
ncbi:MAG: hypothetical protein IJS74_03470 [Clostridia bacterium]|nr:hypothetical protein [Clostridia bacterium]